MAEFADVAVGDDVVLVVEVPPSSELEMVEAGRVHDLMGEATRSLGDTVDAVREAAMLVLAKARSADVVPSQVTVEFGVQLAASAGVVVASTAATANMKLTFTWTDLGGSRAGSHAQGSS